MAPGSRAGMLGFPAPARPRVPGSNSKSRDASGAYRCFRVAKLREVPLERVRSRGYSFQQEVLFRCHKAGCKLGEYPIVFENRRAGASKVNRKEAIRSIAMILYLGLRNVFGLEGSRRSL